MRVIHGYLRLPFLVFALAPPLVFLAVYFLVLSVDLRDEAVLVLNYIVLPLPGLLLLARDWSKRVDEDVQLGFPANDASQLEREAVEQTPLPDSSAYEVGAVKTHVGEWIQLHPPSPRSRRTLWIGTLVAAALVGGAFVGRPEWRSILHLESGRLCPEGPRLNSAGLETVFVTEPNVRVRWTKSENVDLFIALDPPGGMSLAKWPEVSAKMIADTQAILAPNGQSPPLLLDRMPEGRYRAHYGYTLSGCGSWTISVEERERWFQSL